MTKLDETAAAAAPEESGVRKRGERLQIMLDAQELDLIDEWRFEKRMPSRAAAIRELLRRGLRAEGFGDPDRGRTSTDYGVE